MKREFRESNLVSEKIDPLKVLLLLFSFFVCPSNLGGEFFLQVSGRREENEFAFFSQKIVRRKTAEREKSRRETFDEKRENGRREEEKKKRRKEKKKKRRRKERRELAEDLFCNQKCCLHVKKQLSASSD